MDQHAGEQLIAKDMEKVFTTELRPNGDQMDMVPVYYFDDVTGSEYPVIPREDENGIYYEVQVLKDDSVVEKIRIRQNKLGYWHRKRFNREQQILFT